jgi:hypothetical protein
MLTVRQPNQQRRLGKNNAKFAILGSLSKAALPELS